MNTNTKILFIHNTYASKWNIDWPAHYKIANGSDPYKVYDDCCNELANGVYAFSNCNRIGLSIDGIIVRQFLCRQKAE